MVDNMDRYHQCHLQLTTKCFNFSSLHPAKALQKCCNISILSSEEAAGSHSFMAVCVYTVADRLKDVVKLDKFRNSKPPKFQYVISSIVLSTLSSWTIQENFSFVTSTAIFLIRNYTEPLVSSYIVLIYCHLWQSHALWLPWEMNVISI